MVAGILTLIVIFSIWLSLIYAQLKTGVPPMPAKSAEAEIAINLLSESMSGVDKKQGHAPVTGKTIYELGSGWGGLVSRLSKRFPEHQIVGYEISFLPYWVARWRLRRCKNVTLYRKDFLQAKLTDVAGVICYLMIKPMPKVADLLDRQLVSGTPVVSLAFWFRHRSPDRSTSFDQGPGVALYHW